MRVTKIGTDYITINEENLEDPEILKIPKIHLIKMKFEIKNIDECVSETLDRFPQTKRFVIEDNIRDYNRLLKRTPKKFYVENKKGDKLISFFRRNNKVLLNVERITKFELEFVMENIDDILFNTEVLYFGDMNPLFDYLKSHLDTWKGNAILNV